MRDRDKTHFREAAVKFGAWILVRRINEHSMPYIGKPGYTPKPLDCKAKTADYDAGGKTLAGLVVSPTIHPGAFAEKRRATVLACWRKFLDDHGLADQTGDDAESRPFAGSANLDGKGADAAPAQGRGADFSATAQGRGYSIELDKSSVHYGGVKLRNDYVSGDYDLKDIIPVGHECRNLAAIEQLHGHPHMRGPKLYAIQDYVNSQIGCDMVQHGGDAQYTDHSEDIIDVFAPDGRHVVLEGEATIRKFYADMQRGTIDLSKRAPQPDFNDGLTPEQRRARFRVIPGGRA